MKAAAPTPAVPLVRVILSCAKCGGLLELHFTGAPGGQTFSREVIETIAHILDGTSGHFRAPPTPDSIVGRCGKCRSALSPARIL